MGDKYQNKYRVKSARLIGWDYSQPGIYFITICTDKRKMFFGNIKDGKIFLSDVGLIADRFWCEIPQHFDSIELDDCVVMPNHIHGIILINNDGNRRDAIYGVSNRAVYGVSNPDAMNRVSAINGQTRDAINGRLYGVNGGGITGDKNPMGRKGLGEIIRWFKGRTKFEINKKYPHIGFAWQPRFYDRVVRDEDELNNIKIYIDCNPDKWEWDKDNPKNFIGKD